MLPKSPHRIMCEGQRKHRKISRKLEGRHKVHKVRELLPEKYKLGGFITSVPCENIEVFLCDFFFFFDCAEV